MPDSTASGNVRVAGNQEKLTEDWVTLGRIGGAQGLRGALRIQSWTEPREAIGDYASWYLSGENAGQKRRAVKPLKVQAQGKRLVAQLQGIDDRSAAESLAGSVIEVPRAALPELPAGEHYWSDLEGLTVVNREGIELGRIEQMMATGANDVMVVNGDRQRLIPYITGQTVLKVDLEASRVHVDWDKEF